MSIASSPVRPLLWEKAYNSAKHEISFWQTEGAKANFDRTFILQFLGRDIYGLIDLMVEAAKNNDDFDRIRKFVLYVDEIKRQAREQGF
jgi:hypothetical protein